MDKEYKFISAVVYIYNEQKNIEAFIKKLYHYLDMHFLKFEIICVDDASMDDSVDRIKNLVKKEGMINISLISMDIYQGRELAMEAGVDLSIGDYVYELEWIDMFDSEQYEDILWEAYTVAVSGYDIVSYPSRGPKTLLTYMFYKVYNGSNLSHIPLVPERFRIVTRRAINRVSQMNKAIVYRKALYANCGLRTTVIGMEKTEKNIAKKNTKKSKSKLGMAVLLAYTSLFQKAAVFLNLLLFTNLIVSVLEFIHHWKVVKQNKVENKMWIISSVPSFLIGILIMLNVKYQDLILELVLKKKNYVVGSIEKLVNSEK